MIAIGVMAEGFDELFVGSVEIDNSDGGAVNDPEGVAEQVTTEFGGSRPEQVLLVENDVVVAHWNEGKDY
jgi:hypothetical protein